MKRGYVLAAAAILSFSLIFSFIRLFYGVETTDEAFWVAESYLTAQGALPIINEWSSCSTFTLLTAPLIYIYKTITGGTIGIILFMRLAFWLFKLMLLLVIILLFRKKIPIYILIVSSSFFLLVDNGNGQSFSYTNLGVYFLVLQGCLLTVVFSLPEKTVVKKMYCLLGGACSAFCAISYPPQAILSAVSVLTILVMDWRENKSFFNSISFFTGVLIVAVLACGYLIIKGDGIVSFINGIETILFLNPYFSLKTNTATTIFNDLKKIWFVITPQIELGGMILMIEGGYLYLCCKYMRERIKDYFTAFAIWPAYILYLIFSGYKYKGDIKEAFIVLCVPVLLLLGFIFKTNKKEKKFCKSLVYFIVINEIYWLIIAGLSTRDGIYGRVFALTGSVFVFMIISYYSLDSLNIRSGVKSSLLIGTAIIITMSSFVALYSYVYRDAPIFQLNSKVDNGIYKGLYTTEQRKNGVIELQLILNDNLNPDDTVLFMETVPMAYLMTEAKPCTPSTWDISQYTYGFNDDTLYQKYFEKIGGIPKKIVYIDQGRDECLSIDKEGYKFNVFVNENYNLIYRNDKMYFPIRIYEKTF